MELCQETHIAPPEGLGPCITAINTTEGRTPGAAADLLTKVREGGESWGNACSSGGIPRPRILPPCHLH
jgi:hypothetical protein